jgi:hypothetical protein
MNFTTYLLIATLILAAAVAFWLTGAARALFRYRGRCSLPVPKLARPLA